MDEESKEETTNSDHVSFLLEEAAYMVFISSYFVPVPVLGAVLLVRHRYFHGH